MQQTSQRVGALHALIYVIFFLSGLSALIYQVLWTRILTLTFGHTIYAVSTVLTAFMAGLGLGSWIAGRYADRLSRLVRAYGLLEIAIGLFALVIYPVFLNLNALYGPLYTSIGSSFTLLVITRFLLAFFLLLIPTTFMGATIPLLVKAITHGLADLGRKAGRLYAVNTAGAVVGTLAAGFYLIPQLGLHQTNRIAVLLNLVIGLAAAVLPLRSGAIASPEERIEGAGQRRVVYLAAALAGFVALAFEVVWTRSFIFAMFLGSSTYAFSTMLAAFLFGIAFGSYLCSFLVDRMTARAFWFFIFQLVVGVVSVGALTAVIGGFIEPSAASGFFSSAVRDFFKAFVIMLLPTLMMGAAFPLLVRLAARNERMIGREVAQVYAYNTLGAIFGAFFAGFVFIPLLGLAGTAILLGSLSIASGYTVWSLIDRKPRLAWGLACAGLIAVLAILVPRYDFRHGFESQGHSICYYKEGNAATITMTQDEKEWKYFYVDNVFVQGSNNILSLTDIKNLAHLPSLFHPNPRSAATIGFGTGGTSYSFTLYPEYEEINCIEIDLNVPAGSRICFPESNHGLLDHPDPRYHLVNDDARAFMENTDKTFDVITVDLADIAYKGNSDVYTKEFVEQCKERLKPGGMNLIWLSVKSLSPRNLKILLKTFLQVYPAEHLTLWHMTNFPNHDLLVIGIKDQPLSIDWETMVKRMGHEPVRRDLAEIELADPYKLMSSFLVRGTSILDYVGDVPVHTVDRPVLEFESPKDRFREYTMWENMVEIYGQMDDRWPPVRSANQQEFETNYVRYLEAREAFFEGEVATLRANDLSAGFPHYAQAYSLMPSDRSMLHCLGATDELIERYRKKLEQDPRDQMTRLLLVGAHLYRNELDEAEASMGSPEEESAFHYLSARLLEKRGDLARAKEHYLKFMPDASPTYQAEVDARIKVIDLLSSKAGGKPVPPVDLADALIRAREFAQAARVAEDSQAQMGEEGRLWLGKVLVQAGYLGRAADVLDAEVAAHPEKGEAWFQLGLAYLKLRDVRKAKDSFERALAVDRLNPKVYYGLAKCHEILDSKQEAAQLLTQSIQLGGPPFEQLALQDPTFAYRLVAQ